MLGVYLVIMSEALACRPMGERYQRCTRSPSHPGLDYLKIWDLVEQVVLSNQPDSFIWKWTFGWPVLGKIRLPRTLRGTNLPGRRKTDMEDKGTKQMQVFLLACATWLLSERLQRHSLPNHGNYALCDQEAETLNHKLLTCVYSRGTWFRGCYMGCSNTNKKANYRIRQ